MQQALPAHLAWMYQRFKIGTESFPDVPGLPNLFRCVDRHINDKWCSNDIVSRYKAPEPTIVGVVAVIPHHEVFMGWYHELAVHNMRRKFGRPFWPQPSYPVARFRRWEILAGSVD